MALLSICLRYALQMKGCSFSLKQFVLDTVFLALMLQSKL